MNDIFLCNFLYRETCFKTKRWILYNNFTPIHVYFIFVVFFFTDAPLVSLSLGAPLDPYNLMKGSDVYLECDIKANPAAKRVEWFQNVSVVQSGYILVCFIRLSMEYVRVLSCIIRAEYLSRFHLWCCADM